jgi:hypothetical protein
VPAIEEDIPYTSGTRKLLRAWIVTGPLGGMVSPPLCPRGDGMAGGYGARALCRLMMLARRLRPGEQPGGACAGQCNEGTEVVAESQDFDIPKPLGRGRVQLVQQLPAGGDEDVQAVARETQGDALEYAALEDLPGMDDYAGTDDSGPSTRASCSRRSTSAGPRQAIR